MSLRTAHLRRMLRPQCRGAPAVYPVNPTASPLQGGVLHPCLGLLPFDTCAEPSRMCPPVTEADCHCGCLRTAMGSGEVRPTRGHPAPGVLWLHAPLAGPCQRGAAQATTRASRPPRPRGRTRGPRGMLSPGEPGAPLQGRTAGAVPRASAAGSPWPRRIPPAHEGTGGR